MMCMAHQSLWLLPNVFICLCVSRTCAVWLKQGDCEGGAQAEDGNEGERWGGQPAKSYALPSLARSDGVGIAHCDVS